MVLRRGMGARYRGGANAVVTPRAGNIPAIGAVDDISLILLGLRFA